MMDRCVAETGVSGPSDPKEIVPQTVGVAV